ncbi:MAG: RNA methyltransferase, partial [Chloroflexi bacterium]
METAWLEGVISVEAALQAGSRPVYGVYVREGKWDGGVRRVLVAAEACGVPVHRVSASFIAEKATGSTHGGVLAEVGERRFVPLAALLAAERPFLAMLDGVEDPYNFGQAVRALYAAGAHGLVIRARNWLPVAGILARASAGAFERIPIGITETAESAASFFRQHGLTIACATQSDSIRLYQADLT